MRSIKFFTTINNMQQFAFSKMQQPILYYVRVAINGDWLDFWNGHARGCFLSTSTVHRSTCWCCTKYLLTPILIIYITWKEKVIFFFGPVENMDTVSLSYSDRINQCLCTYWCRKPHFCIKKIDICTFFNSKNC